MASASTAGDPPHRPATPRRHGSRLEWPARRPLPSRPPVTEAQERCVPPPTGQAEPGGLPAARRHGMRRAEYNAAGVTASAVITTTAGACRQAAAFPASVPTSQFAPSILVAERSSSAAFPSPRPRPPSELAPPPPTR
jgi:hypothetical protein